jgi:hypothetical protein
MLYHDMQKRLMFWLWLEPGDPDLSSVPFPPNLLKEYQFRIVTSRNQLIEKIRIFDSALDDRIIEFLKLLLQTEASQRQRPINGELLFGALEPGSDGTDSIAFELLTETGSQGFAMPRPAYDQVSTSISPKLPSLASQAGSWLRINRAFAESLARDFIRSELSPRSRTSPQASARDK